MPNLSIKSVPEALAEQLRQRAARSHRSLQGELMAILEAAVAAPPSAVSALPLSAPGSPQTEPRASAPSFAETAAAFRQRFSRPLGGNLDSAAVIREMRDNHYGEAWVMARIKDGPWPRQPGDAEPPK